MAATKLPAQATGANIRSAIANHADNIDTLTETAVSQAASLNTKLPTATYTENKTATDSFLAGINTLKSAGLFNGVIPVGKFVAPAKGFSDGTQTGLTYSYWFRPKVTCTAVQFLFGNWSLGNSSGGAAAEAIGLNPISIAVSVYNVSFRAVYFNGQSSYTIPPGGAVKSDPIPYTFVAGTNYNIRIAVNVETSGMKWPIGLVPQTTLNEGTLPANTLGNGTVTTITTGGYGPFGIIAKPNVKPAFGNIGLFGDSILDGNSNGSTGINYDQGWGRRWLDLINAPWVKFAVGGDKIINHTTDTLTAFVLANSTGIDFAITNYGANDLASATDLQATKDIYLKWWNALSNSGIKVIQSTILPRTSFNATSESIRVQINDWIRTTPAPLWKYIELADIAETSRNSGVWKSGLQTDGTHPTVAGETTIAAALPDASFFNF